MGSRPPAGSSAPAARSTGPVPTQERSGPPLTPEQQAALSGTAVAPVAVGGKANASSVQPGSAVSVPSSTSGRNSMPSTTSGRNSRPNSGGNQSTNFTSTPSLVDQNLPVAPERYGKYHLLERIGVGGMAEVWRAKTMGSEGFTKDLVIKRILPKFTNDEDSVRMFIDEARLVAKLHHPNIVQIFDFDKEGDRYFLAMELVEGRDLRQAEKASAKAGIWFPIPISIYMISEALKGLHYAHTRLDHGKALEIVHRDISPHNILISFSGDVKISDFGIAKVAAHASASTTGTVKGKLAYMSPEQITGQPLDGRTDIYSMGIVLWELLTRHRLFFGPDEHDVIRRVRDGIVPPPRQYNPQIPEEIERIVMKMLVANRANRYQNAGEVARALTALPQYAYEAQSLGEFMRTLFPEQTRNWTKMLQSLLSSPASRIAVPTDPSLQIEIAPLTSVIGAADDGSAKVKVSVAKELSLPPTQNDKPSTIMLGTQELLSVDMSASAAASSVVPAPAAAPSRPTAAPKPPEAIPAAAAPKLPEPPPTVTAIPVPPSVAASPLPAPVSVPAPAPPQPLSPPPAAPTTTTPPAPPTVPRSPMSGSDQKTQLATEVPPQVAAAMAGQAGPSGGAAAARTMIAEAPGVPSGAPPAAPPSAPPMSNAGARTILASAPALPPGPGVPASQQATLFAVPTPGLPPQHGTVPPPRSPSLTPPPLQLRPAAMLLESGAQTVGGLPPMARWVIGPGIALVVALITTFIANRIWVPTTGGGGGGPSFLAAKRSIKIYTEPSEAEVQVDGVAIEDKTPTEISGEIGKSARVRITLKGYDPYEATLSFTQDKRPPLRVRLQPAGSKKKTADPSAFDSRPTAPGTEEEPKEPVVKPEDTKPVKPEDTKPVKPEDTKPVKPEDTKSAKPDDEKGEKKHSRKDKDTKAVKPTLTVLVRPWAIVFIDGKKIQQTPLRNHPISPGQHKITLRNENKGKIEEIKLNVSAGSPIPEIKRNWE